MSSTGLEHLHLYFQPEPVGGKKVVVHPEIAPDCPHATCGEPMRSFGDAAWECPHDHRTEPPTPREPARFPDIPLI